MSLALEGGQQIMRPSSLVASLTMRNENIRSAFGKAARRCRAYAAASSDNQRNLACKGYRVGHLLLLAGLEQ
jgi:hypothetical protein